MSSGLTAEDLAVFGALHLPLCEWAADGDSVSFRGRDYIITSQTYRITLTMLLFGHEFKRLGGAP